MNKILKFSFFALPFFMNGISIESERGAVNDSSSGGRLSEFPKFGNYPFKKGGRSTHPVHNTIKKLEEIVEKISQETIEESVNQAIKAMDGISRFNEFASAKNIISGRSTDISRNEDGTLNYESAVKALNKLLYSVKEIALKRMLRFKVNNKKLDQSENSWNGMPISDGR